jgi:RecB family exonuclease
MSERRKWMAEEDEILRREVLLQGRNNHAASNHHSYSHSPVEIGQLKQWNLVAAELPGRTNKDCRKRWAKLDNNVKKGAWSTSEDEKLHAAVQELGCK